MPKEKAGLDAKMDQIANFVADKILGNEEVTKDLNDAFKTLTTYWTNASKLDKVSPEDEDTTSGGFGGIRRRIAEAGSDAPQGNHGGPGSDPIPIRSGK